MKHYCNYQRCFENIVSSVIENLFHLSIHTYLWAYVCISLRACCAVAILQNITKTLRLIKEATKTKSNDLYLSLVWMTHHLRPFWWIYLNKPIIGATATKPDTVKMTPMKTIHQLFPLILSISGDLIHLYLHIFTEWPFL